jgi:mono/diheme cytochrome c family protein
VTAAPRRNEVAGTLAGALVAVGVLFALRLVLVRDVAQRNADLFPDMAYSPAGKSQGDAGGEPTDRSLVAGVVPRGRLPFRYAPGPDEAKRAGAELANPFRTDDAVALARGDEVFRVWCSVCHGAGGEGDGTAVLRGMVKPPSLLADRARAIKDGEAFHIMTMGQGNMASYAVQVAPEDRWKAILHVRVLQKGKAQ